MTFPYFIVTHFFAEGPAIFLHQYLKDRGIAHVYIEHPFIFSSRRVSRRIIWMHDRAPYEIKGISILKIALLYYVRDFFITIIWGMRCPSDTGIGFDNLNTLALLILRFFGFLKRVVYVTVDYTPKRFENRFMNFLYHRIDRFCCYRADMLWDSAERMQSARQRNGVDVKRMKPIIVVDDGNDFSEEKIRSYESLKKYQLVYMGHMRKYQGVELLIDVIKILHRWNTNVSLLFIGGGELLDPLKKYVADQGLNDIIHFTGYMEDHEEVQEKLRFSYLAFALYEDDPNSFSKYSAVGKPKVYMGCGLPVMITDVPEIARKIELSGGGKIVPYNAHNIAETVKSIITDDTAYRTMRSCAIAFAKKNTWKAIFEEAFQKSNAILRNNLIV